MKTLSQKVYSKWTTKFNRTVNNEEGSQAVEFMGIAAVVIMVIFAITKWMDSSGNGLIEGVLGGIFDKVKEWF